MDKNDNVNMTFGQRVTNKISGINDSKAAVSSSYNGIPIKTVPPVVKQITNGDTNDDSEDDSSVMSFNNKNKKSSKYQKIGKKLHVNDKLLKIEAYEIVHDGKVVSILTKIDKAQEQVIKMSNNFTTEVSIRKKYFKVWVDETPLSGRKHSRDEDGSNQNVFHNKYFSEDAYKKRIEESLETYSSDALVNIEHSRFSYAIADMICQKDKLDGFNELKFSDKDIGKEIYTRLIGNHTNSHKLHIAEQSFAEHITKIAISKNSTISLKTEFKSTHEHFVHPTHVNTSYFVIHDVDKPIIGLCLSPDGVATASIKPKK